MFADKNVKPILLNALALTYTASLALFLAADAAGTTDKSWAIDNMKLLALATVAAFFSLLLISISPKARVFNSPVFLTVSFLLSMIVSLRETQFSFTELFDESGTAGAARLFSGLAHANLNLLPEAIVEILETIFVAFLATAIAVPLAFVLAFFCAKNIMNRPVTFAIYGTLRTLLNLIRSVEPLIWAVIFSVWVGIGPFAGMLALMLHSVASLTKQYSEIIESVDDGPIDGIRATGANRVQVIWFGIVPQVVLPYIAFTFYRWDINVRMATVIGLAGGGGIGTLLLKYQGQAMWPEVGCIILVIAAVVWIMDTASAYVREAVK